MVRHLFDTYVLLSAEQQEHVREVIDGRVSSADLDHGVVSFHPGLRTRAELVGTEATGPGAGAPGWSGRDPGRPGRSGRVSDIAGRLQPGPPRRTGMFRRRR